MKKGFFKKFFTKKYWTETKAGLILLSFAMAVVLWAVVVMSVNSNTTRTLYGIKVQIPSSGASYHALGLDIMETVEYMANVVVSGDRSVVGALSEDSVVVVPDFSSVTEAGTYSIRLVAQKNNQLMDYTVEGVSPYSVTMTFAEATTKKLSLTPRVSGYTVKDGFVMQTAAIYPASVTVIGASENVDRISSAVVSVDFSGRELDSTQTVSGDVRFYDSNGEEISRDYLRVDQTSAEVTVPVLKKGVLPLSVGFINLPDGFDTSILNYSLSPSSVEVASSVANIESLTSKNVGYIDLADFEIGKTYEFEIALSSGYVLLEDSSVVTVSFDGEDLSTKKINVRDIRIENLPAGYSAESLTEVINGVTLMGPKDAVDALNPTSVVAVVDLGLIQVQQGKFNAPVRFELLGSNSVWVVGNYTAVVEAAKN